MSDFLLITREEASRRGWNELDVVLVTGDAYVDHPSFGASVIGRVLESRGYRVGIIAMPDWRNPAAVRVFGRPRLFFGVTSGNVDSMLARYTAFKKVRNDDPYVPGGAGGVKPEHAVITYCNLIKAAYKDVPIVIGGIEASMRRIAHYDFLGDKVRRSILGDAKADILAYGMAEQAVVEIAGRIASGRWLEGIPGTVIMAREAPEGSQILPREEEVIESPEAFEELYRTFFRSQDMVLVQPAGKRFIVHYPPALTTTTDLDRIYALPYRYAPHPAYAQPIPAFEMIKDSITSHRGCVSGCSFCAVSLHQGRRIISRSAESVLSEIDRRVQTQGFKGHITDIGGPSANMYGFDCRSGWQCQRESCTFPQLCHKLVIRTRAWMDLLDNASAIKGIAHVTVGSGIRYDLLMRDPERETILETLIARHISGQLKIAPEHTSPSVLTAMRKTPVFDLKDFVREFRATTASLGKKRYLLPYLMSCHPGCSLEDMHAMHQEIYGIFGLVPRQVQAFIPLPMTLSSVMYCTGTDPLTRERSAVERDMTRRRTQHQVFSSRAPRPSRGS